MSATPASGVLFIHSAPPVTLHISVTFQRMNAEEYKEETRTRVDDSKKDEEMKSFLKFECTFQVIISKVVYHAIAFFPFT
jgi:hypothetical protein